MVIKIEEMSMGLFLLGLAVGLIVGMYAMSEAVSKDRGEGRSHSSGDDDTEE